MKKLLKFRKPSDKNDSHLKPSQGIKTFNDLEWWDPTSGLAFISDEINFSVGVDSLKKYTLSMASTGDGGDGDGGDGGDGGTDGNDGSCGDSCTGTDGGGTPSGSGDRK